MKKITMDENETMMQVMTTKPTRMMEVIWATDSFDPSTV